MTSESAATVVGRFRATRGLAAIHIGFAIQLLFGLTVLILMPLRPQFFVQGMPAVNFAWVERGFSIVAGAIVLTGLYQLFRAEHELGGRAVIGAAMGFAAAVGHSIWYIVSDVLSSSNPDYVPTPIYVLNGFAVIGAFAVCIGYLAFLVALYDIGRSVKQTPSPLLVLAIPLLLCAGYLLQWLLPAPGETGDVLLTLARAVPFVSLNIAVLLAIGQVRLGLKRRAQLSHDDRIAEGLEGTNWLRLRRGLMLFQMAVIARITLHFIGVFIAVMMRFVNPEGAIPVGVLLSEAGLPIGIAAVIGIGIIAMSRPTGTTRLLFILGFIAGVVGIGVELDVAVDHHHLLESYGVSRHNFEELSLLSLIVPLLAVFGTLAVIGGLIRVCKSLQYTVLVTHARRTVRLILAASLAGVILYFVVHAVPKFASLCSVVVGALAFVAALYLVQFTEALRRRIDRAFL